MQFHTSFILRDKDLENHVNPQMVNMKNGGGERVEIKDADNKVNDLKEINEVNYGDHFTKGKRGRKELVNVRYVTQDGYKYTTDELRRSVDVEADNLILQEADRNLGMQRAAGREDRLPDDDGGNWKSVSRFRRY